MGLAPTFLLKNLPFSCVKLTKNGKLYPSTYTPFSEEPRPAPSFPQKEPATAEDIALQAPAWRTVKHHKT